MDLKEIRKIYKLSLSNPIIVNSYLKGRKLSNSKIKKFGYISRYKGENFKIVDSIVIPILDLNLNVMGLECRSMKSEGTVRYNKLFADELDIPIYGLRNPNFTSSYVLLTEGVFDCESLLQLGYNSVSGLRASTPNIVLHYMALFFDKIILAFDNDKAGKDNALRIIKFYNKHYPDIETDVLDFKGSDINKSKQSFIKSLKISLKEVI